MELTYYKPDFHSSKSREQTGNISNILTILFNFKFQNSYLKRVLKKKL